MPCIRLTARAVHRTSLVLATAVILALVGAATATSGTVPAGFQEQTVFSGLVNPTALRFSSDGRVFVAEKSGRIKVFDDLSDTTPTLFADLNKNVYNFWDRGLLGLALHPDFPATPYVYVLYTHDAEIGGTAPKWGTEGILSDPCPNPPGATGDGCVVSGRLSRLQASGNTVTGNEHVLIEDWCQQYPSHSIGGLEFGMDGALYVTGGEGASFNWADYGQDGNPLNPCGDPPVPVGGTQAPPTAEGGALRSQDLRTSGDPVTLDGALLRVDPTTGGALPSNPFAANADPNARRIVAYGLRNPFRFAIRPGTTEIWIGDVGWGVWEEINRVPDPADSVVENFGWPCYEGPARQGGYDSANLNICENLYGEAGAHTQPFFAYRHSDQVVSGESCPTGSSSVSGLAFEFYSGGSYPSDYAGALFFADYSRDCIWAMKSGGNGLPAPGLLQTFVAGAANPVDLQIGPNGDLFYVDLDGGTIRRIRHTAANSPPVAAASAFPTSGAAPLTVNFDASRSSDPDAGDSLSYAWDLDGDGAHDDSTVVAPSHTYMQAGRYLASLQVTDARGASDTDAVTITVDNTAPTATIESPLAEKTWTAAERITFSGSASDGQDGALPASALSWSLILHHCPSNCHTHALQTWNGVASGAFDAPDHEYPSHLELRLTATDSGGLTDTESVLLHPETVQLSFQTSPSGLELAFGSSTEATPFTRTVIKGSSNSLSAPSPQTLGGRVYVFDSWSDGGAQTHAVTASADVTYTAGFELAPTQTSVFVPVADAYVRSDQNRKNFGTLATLRVRQGTSGSATTYRSYVKFDVAGLSGPVTSATLRLHVTDPSSSGGSAYTVGSTWTETGLTWSSAPPLATTSLSSVGQVALNTWVELDVTSAIAGNGTYSFAVAGGNTDSAIYASREGANPPQLLVVYNSSQPPPPTADFTANPSSGQAPLAVSFTDTSTGGPTSWAWDFGDGMTSTLQNPSHTYSQPGTYAATLTASNAGGSSVKRRTVVVFPVGATAADAFSRTIALGSGWGSADVGGTWKLSTTSKFGVDGSAGQTKLDVAGQTQRATIGTNTDAEVVAKVKLPSTPTGGSLFYYLLGRFVDGSNHYRLVVEQTSSGSGVLSLNRVLSGGTTVLQTKNVGALAAGDWYWMRLRIVGTALYGRVWQDGAAEPDWQLTTNDTTFSSGAVGVGGRPSVSNTSLPTIRWDDFWAMAAQ